MMERSVRVDGREIPAGVIAAEMQHHPAPSAAQAWNAAATALVVRELLLNEADRLGVLAAAEEDEGEDEARIRALLAAEVEVAEPDDSACRAWHAAHADRYRGRDIHETAHILLPAPADNPAARDAARLAAERLIAAISEDADRFAALARAHSACPSAAQGGSLGQLGRGELVEELETFIFALEPGQLCPVPVMTRYGAHVLRLERMERGVAMPYEIARPAVEQAVRARLWQDGVARFLRRLAAAARVEGLPEFAVPA